MKNIIENESEIIDKELGNEENDYLKKEGEIKETKINKAFAIFLYNVAQYLDKHIFKEICFFVCLYRKSLNEFGWDTLNEENQLNSNEKIDKEKEFCEENNCENALEICNKFNTKILPFYLKNYSNELKEFKLIGLSMEKHKIILNLTKQFCNWLFYHNYTNSKLEFNEGELI